MADKATFQVIVLVSLDFSFLFLSPFFFRFRIPNRIIYASLDLVNCIIVTIRQYFTIREKATHCMQRYAASSAPGI